VCVCVCVCMYVYIYIYIYIYPYANGARIYFYELVFPLTMKIIYFNPIFMYARV
jgi:hypothetical protein